MITLVEDQDSGKSLVVDVVPTSGGTSVRLFAPRDFLDDEVGDNADTTARLAYLQKNEVEVAKVAEAVMRGSGSVRLPFNRIRLYRS